MRSLLGALGRVWPGLAMLPLAGCIVTGFDNKTTICLESGIAVARDKEVVEIPLSLVRKDIPAFDTESFSVHLLPKRAYAHGDPNLATSPHPEVPAQITDRDLDGQGDTILVAVDFGPDEDQFVEVCSPRFSPLLPTPTSMVSGGLWRRQIVREEGNQVIGEGEYISTQAAVLPAGIQTQDGLFFLNGVLFESDTQAWRLGLDSRLALDVIGKRSAGLVLDRAARTGTDPGLPVINGPGSPFGAGRLGVWEGDVIRPLENYNSVQYRLVEDGPVAVEVEILLNGCRMGGQAFDVKWHITAFHGSNYLRHDVSVSDGGHRLAFGISDGGGQRVQQPSSRSGWMQAATFGVENCQTNGQVGIGLMAKGSQSVGYASQPADVIGVRFDPMLTEFTWFTIAAWDQGPAAIASLPAFQGLIQDLATRVNNPPRVGVRPIGAIP